MMSSDVVIVLLLHFNLIIYVSVHENNRMDKNDHMMELSIFRIFLLLVFFCKIPFKRYQSLELEKLQNMTEF